MTEMISPIQVTQGTNPIESFLLSKSSIFQSLRELRSRGWQNKRADEHFQKQRKGADEAGWYNRRIFFDIMRDIGDEMQAITDALKCSPVAPAILDLCMAPGGYTSSALKYNPSAQVSAISLPRQLGGHEVLVPNGLNDPRVRIKYLDITLLVKEFVTDDIVIPKDHPDHSKFLSDRPYLSQSFDLVFCDGQVLRTHEPHRSAYREINEATRLICSQLILALQRIKTGGTLIMLLHKVDRWDTVQLLNIFDQIAEIQLFKPLRAHRTRSSFYLVAKDIRPDSVEGLAAIERWKKAWRTATFGPEKGNEDDILGEEGNSLHPHATELGDGIVSAVIERFGDRLVHLGDPIWKIQKEALEKAAWK